MSRQELVPIGNLTKKEPRKVVKFTANIPIEIFNVLRDLADERDTTVTHVIRQSISTLRFFHESKLRGETIYLRKPGQNQMVEVVESI